MKTKPWIVVLVLLGFTTGWAATFEFSALLQAGKETRFVVTNVDTGRTSGWIRLGRAFDDHALVFFDPQAEVLSLRTGGDIIELPLRPAFSAGQSSPEEKRVQILRNLLVLADAAERYFREKQVTEVEGRAVAEHFKLAVPVSVDGEDYLTLMLRQGVPMSLKTRSGIEIEYPGDLDEVRAAAK